MRSLLLSLNEHFSSLDLKGFVGYVNKNDISTYIRKIQKFPILSHENEARLATEWIENRSDKAAHALINSHLRLVVKIAMKFRGYGLQLSELVSEGNLGLIQSLERFDPKKGFRLSTYAMWWIRASIQEYILHSWSLVKIGTTAAQKKLFFNLRSLKGKLKALDDGDLPPEMVTEIAERLSVSENEVVDMNRRLAGHDHSLNNPYSLDNTEEWINGLPDERENHENIFINKDELFKRKEMLMSALKNLDDRERRILTQRRLVDDPLTLDELSKSFGISRERVRQVEVRAFEKIRKVVKNINYKILLQYFIVIIFILVTFTSHYACSNQNEILSQETVEITFVTKQDASLYGDVLNKEIIDEIPAFIKVNALEKIVVSATDNEKVYYKTIFNNKEGWLEAIYLADIKKDNNKKNIIIKKLKEAPATKVNQTLEQKRVISKTTSSGNYYVQIASFRNENNAKNLFKDLS